MYDHTLYLNEVAEADRGHVEDMLDHLDDHCRNGWPVGGFLRSVVLGDLDGAAANADGTNKKYLSLYARYCYNQLPTARVRLLAPVAHEIHLALVKDGSVTHEQCAEAARAFGRSLQRQITGSTMKAGMGS